MKRIATMKSEIAEPPFHTSPIHLRANTFGKRLNSSLPPAIRLIKNFHMEKIIVILTTFHERLSSIL